jgi:hypothetical protein
MTSVDIVTSLYDAFARHDLPGVLRRLDTDVAWHLADGNPYAAGPEPLVGRDAVMIHVLNRIVDEWSEVRLNAMQVHAAGDVVTVQARFRGRNDKTGRRLDVDVCHIWTLREGRAVRVQEYIDTARLRYAMAVRSRGGIAGWDEAGPSVEGGTEAA